MCPNDRGIKTMTDTERIARSCEKCNVNDTHSHHVQYSPIAHPITGELIDLSVTKHIQCCAADGCPVCTTDLEFATVPQVTTPSDEFTAYMQAKSDAHHIALFERHGISSAVSDAVTTTEVSE